MNELSALKLGEVNYGKPAGGGRVTFAFTKFYAVDCDIEAAMELGERLNEFEVFVNDYINSFENNENMLCLSKKQRVN